MTFIKQITSIFCLSLFVINCVSVEDTDTSFNFEGVQGQNFFGGRTFSFTFNDKEISGELNQKFIGYEVSYNIWGNELKGKISVALNDAFELEYNDKKITGFVQHRMVKDIIELNQGDIILEGEMGINMTGYEYNMVIDQMEISGSLYFNFKGFTYEIVINNKKISGEILSSMAKEVYHLNADDLGEMEMLAFIIIDIIRCMNVDEQRRKSTD